MNSHAGQIDLESPTYGMAKFLGPHGHEISVPVARLSRHHVVLEWTDPELALRASEALGDFAVQLGGRTAYRGRAVVTRLVQAADHLVVEVALEEGWQPTDLVTANGNPAPWRGAFDGFVSHWQKHHRVRPEFKVLLADMQTFLTDLRLWLEQVEAGLSAGLDDPAKIEERVREAAAGLSPHSTATLTHFFERFETLAAELDLELHPLHRAYTRRQLHPLLLCAPFLHRTFHKPLGYAGDYGMVNMILGDTFAGGSLYARLVNHWFLEQPPAEAHRNRLDYLCAQISSCTVRAASQNRAARILSLGCGPAHEVQRFLEQQPFSDRARFTLVDFNQETLNYTQTVLEEVRRRHRRSTPVETVRKSVAQILKEAGRANEGPFTGQFDLVYCAGLFDYLLDPTCRRLMEVLYAWTAPGGQLITTNVDVSNPRQLIMDFVMDWHLIYRNGGQLAALAPVSSPADDSAIRSDLTGVNIFLETRKPARD